MSDPATPPPEPPDGLPIPQRYWGILRSRWG